MIVKDGLDEFKSDFGCNMSLTLLQIRSSIVVLNCHQLRFLNVPLLIIQG
jgi:hypothetical protein